MPQEWRVGELARATGLTVRTLHHYDELGLLKPGARTPSGHRLYSDADVRRLYSVYEAMYEQEGPEKASRGMVYAELMAYAQPAIEAREDAG